MAGKFSSIEYAVSDGLAHVTLNMPDRGNPIDQTFCREISVEERRSDELSTAEHAR
jgi:hypothetical protein